MKGMSQKFQVTLGSTPIKDENQWNLSSQTTPYKVARLSFGNKFGKDASALKQKLSEPNFKRKPSLKIKKSLSKLTKTKSVGNFKTIDDKSNEIRGLIREKYELKDACSGLIKQIEYLKSTPNLLEEKEREIYQLEKILSESEIESDNLKHTLH